uniref:Phosphatase PP2A regulatory subunit A/Splicing factor 3B subunit 1-like HEAT repeat domain-containing protein n=1 Tax=Rhizochromulina marina TaxID=1034831 RepID=A0A7S2WVY8_9STRA|mmetsp:Transcript_917/g.2989  ORF Transcript_917/g.2989 Transcript_917/m.2989 type:complete len:636 (+) Transcript_917:2-1909(+)
MEPTDLAEIAKLLDDLKDDEIQTRVAATTQLSRIALALGPERSRDELIPFLVESVDDEDEVVMEIGKELANMIPLVGGAEHAHLLLEPLRRLALVEDRGVREQAVQSISSIVRAMPPSNVDTYWFPVLQELKAHDFHTGRISACALAVAAFSNFSEEHKAAVLATMEDLGHDETPMVRCAAAKNLSILARELDLPKIQDSLLPLFTSLASDDQDSVRLQTVDSGISIASQLPSLDVAAAEAVAQRTSVANTPAVSDAGDIMRTSQDEAVASGSEQHPAEEFVEPAQKVLLVILRTATDRAWRVRWSVASRFEDLVAAFGSGTQEILCRTFDGLLQDPEPEVRTAAAGRVTKVAAELEEAQVLQSILPRIAQQVTDASDHVRAALALDVNGLAPVLGRQHTIDHLLPLLLGLLRDTNSEVRLNLISRLGEMNDVIGVELLAQSLLPTILDLARDQKWRVRMAIIDHMPMLAEKLGPGFFDEKLCGQCIAWLCDDVFTIRIAAAENTRKLTEFFGQEWFQTCIYPQVSEMCKQDTSLARLMSLVTLQATSKALNNEFVEQAVLPIALSLASDPIPNIRFNVAKALQFITPSLEPSTVSATVLPALENLAQDSDRDVMYFSGKAITAIGAATGPTAME